MVELAHSLGREVASVAEVRARFAPIKVAQAG